MTKTDARKLSPEVLEHLRRQALSLRTQGYTWGEIANICGVHISTCLKWSRRANSLGEEAAIKGAYRGRLKGAGRTLTPAQEIRLHRMVLESTPEQMELPFALWTRRAVMEAVNKLFGIDMPIRTVGQYLLRWGFTPQRPAKKASGKKEVPQIPVDGGLGDLECLLQRAGCNGSLRCDDLVQQCHMAGPRASPS